MKKLLLFFTLSSSIAFSQNFEWAKNIGGTGEDRGNVIRLDDAGNIYVAGSFSETADFNPGTGAYSLTSTGEMDMYVAKYDASGDFLWAVSDGNIYDEFILDMVIDATGNVYITGYGEIVSDGSQRALFVAKLDASGTTLWDHTFYSNETTIGGYTLALDASGNVYVGGNFNGTVDFDPGSSDGEITTTGNVGSSDPYILKLDANGFFVWVKQFTVHAANANVYDICLDASGNIYTTGQFWNNAIDCDPGPGTQYVSNAGSGDIFISKLDANGDYVWAKGMGGSSNEYGFSITTDASGNVYTCGYFEGTVDFDPGAGTHDLSSGGSRDIYISKLDSNGDFVWAKGMGSTGDDRGQELVLDASGNVYVIGCFEGSVDFDAGSGTHTLTSLGEKDVFVSKLNNSGNFEWANSFGAAMPPNPSPGFTATDYGYSIVLDASNNIYTAGFFVETVDFDPGSGTSNLSSNGNRDSFFAKWNQPIAGLENNDQNEITLYPNPTTGIVYLSNLAEEVMVFELNGRLIESHQGTLNQLDLSHLSKGVYLLRIQTPNSLETERVIVM